MEDGGTNHKEARCSLIFFLFMNLRFCQQPISLISLLQKAASVHITRHTQGSPRGDKFYADWVWWILQMLPFQHLVRVMDCFLNEGIKVRFYFWHRCFCAWSIARNASFLSGFLQSGHGHSISLLQVFFATKFRMDDGNHEKWDRYGVLQILQTDPGKDISLFAWFNYLSDNCKCRNYEKRCQRNVIFAEKIWMGNKVARFFGFNCPQFDRLLKKCVSTTRYIIHLVKLYLHLFDHYV